jgi:hypothetical protein
MGCEETGVIAFWLSLEAGKLDLRMNKIGSAGIGSPDDAPDPGSSTKPSSKR